MHQQRGGGGVWNDRRRVLLRSPKNIQINFGLFGYTNILDNTLKCIKLGWLYLAILGGFDVW